MNTELNSTQTEQILTILSKRISSKSLVNVQDIWSIVQDRLEQNPQKLWSLYQMEESGGEPNIVAFDQNTNECAFYDCVAESPKGRRSFCYDPQALASRKEYKPSHSAIGFAKEIRIELLTEEEYRFLQTFSKFDTKTSSWLLTPKKIRDLGGAIFGDCRYDTVFKYHNGAESYYASRGFRGKLVV